MDFNGRDRLSDLLLPFHDGNYFLEDELKQILNQIAPSETGAYEELLHSLVFPDSDISRFVLELVLSGEAAFLLQFIMLIPFSS